MREKACRRERRHAGEREEKRGEMIDWTLLDEQEDDEQKDSLIYMMSASLGFV